MIIYKTTNNINGKIYVGKYCGKWKGYLGSGKYIKRVLKKYGKENFTREILEDDITDHDYLCEREKYWIKFYDSMNPEIGYNLTAGGEGTVGFRLSDEAKEKISKSRMLYRGKNNPFYGKKHSEETKEKMSKNHADFRGENAPMFGKKHSDETIKKMSEAHQNPSDETRKKMSESQKGKVVSEKTKKKLSIALRGKNNPFYGKKHTKEAREKMSIAKKGRYSRENHPWWGRHHTEETRKLISKNHSNVCGKNNPNITKKNIVLKILDMLNRKMKKKDICKNLNVCHHTVSRVENGWFDEIYNLKKLRNNNE